MDTDFANPVASLPASLHSNVVLRAVYIDPVALVKTCAPLPHWCPPLLLTIPLVLYLPHVGKQAARARSLLEQLCA